MRHSTSWRTHLSHDHHIVSKRKWGTQSRCPGLRCILHFRTYWPDANFCHLHGPPLSSPLPYLTYLSIHVSSILRAAVAETSTRHWSQWCNEVQWPVIILHYPDQVTYGLQLSQRDPSAWSERKKWPFMLFKRCHQKWVCKARNVRGPSPQMLSLIPKGLTVGAERSPLIHSLPVT